MDEDNDVRWGLAQRFEFMEWRAYWVGRVNRKDLEDEFQISTPQASVDFRNYLEAAPGNIEYSATEKTYVVTNNFRPKFLKLSPERYLLQLQALSSDAIRKSDTWFDEVPPADVTPTIVRGPEAYTLRAIIKTIEMGGAININYQSLTRTDVRSICPHALAHDGYRWHVRALSLEHGEYRDYVLGRILSVSEPTPCGADPSDDVEWQTKVKLKLIAHPDLNPDQKATIEHDYRLEKGELTVEMRLALAFYFIKRHNLDLRKGEIAPERAQLFLQNFEELTAALKEANEQSRALIAARRLRASTQ
jgi:predicted DNA-binding transcriptional regulator YafY